MKLIMKMKNHTPIFSRGFFFFSILTMSFVTENISGNVKFRNNIVRMKAYSFSIFLMHVCKTNWGLQMVQMFLA